MLKIELNSQSLLLLSSKKHRMPFFNCTSAVRYYFGNDGRTNARYGDIDHSLVNLNDSRLIAELYHAFLLNKSALQREMQRLADLDASILHETLCMAIDTDIKKVIIATHIPPVPESSWHKDKPNDENWLPYFASKASGDVIMNVVKQHADIQFLVLCGHTHTAVTTKPFDNLIIKSGHAENYKPIIQEIFFFEVPLSS